MEHMDKKTQHDSARAGVRRAIFHEKNTPLEQCRLMRSLLADSLEELAGTLPPVFTGASARVALIGRQMGLQPELIFFMKMVLEAEPEDFAEPAPEAWLPMMEAAAVLFERMEAGEQAGAFVLEGFAAERWDREQAVERHAVRRLLLLQAEDDGRHIRALDTESGRAFSVAVPAEKDSAGYPHPLGELLQHELLPIEVNALGLQFHGRHARAVQWVLDPDYLVDVSTISESFKPEGPLPEMQIVNRFKPRLPSSAIILGNLVNYFLDEMIRDEDISFEALLATVFRQQALGLALLNDEAVRQLVANLRTHYGHLRQVLRQDFPALHFSAPDCLLEPSFFSERYGLQGRLDLLTHRDGRPVIVELKSGKPYRENRHGLSISHYIQTLLYDLLIRSAHDNRIEPDNYILYSALPEKNLRHAPRSQKLQQAALDVRNRLIIVERKLMRAESLPNDWLTSLVDAGHPALRFGFVKNDHREFLASYSALDDLEKSYLRHYLGFLSREQYLSKTGGMQSRQSRGMACLWLEKLEDKIERFDILAYLRWERTEHIDEQPVLVFSRSEKSNPLSNFRTGDIGVLYGEAGERSALRQQLYRGSIVHMDSRELHFRLRSKQVQDSDIRYFRHWHIEKDVLDSGFTNSYAQLGRWMRLGPDVRRLLLGRRAPMRPEAQSATTDYRPQGLNDRQARIFTKIIAAPEYFLLWGPPGTGKTSVMLRELCRYWIRTTDDNMLLLAYTNRAVDEICEALEAIGCEDYVRVGSRYACGMDYREKLLEQQIRKFSRREQLLDFLQSRRVFVSTVSSISGKPELMHIKRFQTLVVDEASQVTEPMMIGLPAMFDKFVLIGDHRQLPAVVQQDARHTAVDDTGLRDIGMRSLADSLFERLYLRAMDQGWDWAYDQLSHQGRMHRDIAEFPNRYFYQGSLALMEGVPAVMERQLAPLPARSTPDGDGPGREESGGSRRQGSASQPPGADDANFHENKEREDRATANHGPGATAAELLQRHRLLFIDIPTDPADPAGKTNANEAFAVRALLAALTDPAQPPEKAGIGIITPYRSQIALLSKAVTEAGLDAERITVDTVERYQGGARKVIILSLCLNRRTQLDQLVNRAADGTDRKLNVALTRAREQLIVLGNRSIMQYDEVYRALEKHIAEKGYSGDLQDLVGLEG